jgi:hypothetical protein
MNGKHLSHLKWDNTAFCFLALLGSFLIILGLSTDFIWLKSLLDSYVADGNCDLAKMLDFSRLILPTIGLTLILFSLALLRTRHDEEADLIIPLQCLIFCIISVYVILIHTRKLDNDEYEHMHNAWLMLEGTIPFFSTKMMHMPLLEWIAALVIKMTGEKVIVVNMLRHMIFVTSLISLYLIYLITVNLFYRKTIAYIALILLLTNFVWLKKSFEIRPDNIMLVFFLFSFLCLIKYNQTSKIRYLFFFGLSALLSTLGKQNAAIFYFALALAFLYSLIIKEKRFRFHFLIFSIIVIMIGFSIAPIRDFFSINISRHLIPNDAKFWPTSYIISSFIFNPLLYIVFIFGVINLHKIECSDTTYVYYIFIIICTCFLFLFLMNTPWLQEMLLMSAFLCVITSGVLFSFFNKVLVRRSVVFLFLVLYTLPFFIYSSHFGLKKRRQIFTQMETTRIILKISDKDDLVFDSYGKPIFRHHPLEPNYLMYAPEKFSLLSDLKSASPRFLIKDEYYSRLPKSTIDWFEDKYVSIPENRYIFVHRDFME